MLISQPGSDYQLTGITLDAGRARDITFLLLDIHAVLDQLHLDGTRPEITSTADAILRESGSPYTPPGLTDALDEVSSQLPRATRQAIAGITPPSCPVTMKIPQCVLLTWGEESLLSI